MFLESIFPLDQSNTIMAFNTHIFIMKYKKKKIFVQNTKIHCESGGGRNCSLRRVGLEVSTGSS